MVRSGVEETLNQMLEAEGEKLTQAARYESNETRQGYRTVRYDRNLTATSGDVALHMSRLKGLPFETAILEMYLSVLSVHRVEDITEALWCSIVDLKYKSDPSAPHQGKFLILWIKDVLPLDQHLTAGGAIQPTQNMEHAGFAHNGIKPSLLGGQARGEQRPLP